jgi:hypothetical protein
MTCAHKAIQIPDTQFDPLTDLDLGSILLIGLKSRIPECRCVDARRPLRRRDP